ncbi:MAG TPA: sugar transferase, partial [Candidatus Paceibacterota bacterium]
MISSFRPSSAVLLIGDLVCFAAALWITLFLRALSFPSLEQIVEHIVAFMPLFVVWVLVFLIAGLYEGRRLIFARRALSTTLLYAQTVNVIIAALVFFIVPLFGIAPKTVLLIYLIVSVACVLLWRAYLYPMFGLQKSSRAIVVGNSPEIEELAKALHSAPLSPVSVVAVIDPKNDGAALQAAIETYHPQWFVADIGALPHSGISTELLRLIRSGVRIIDARSLYEDIFGRVPLSSVDDRWVARNASRYVHALYDPLKRLMDIAAGLILGAISLIFYPFIILAIKLQDGGEAIIAMPRIGEGNTVFNLYKFRSMSGNDKGEWSGSASTLHVTPVGRVLRGTRLDELPQLWNVLRGDMSLIGPRPETPDLVGVYEKEIPYYGARHLIKPGVSGWAQLYGE